MVHAWETTAPRNTYRTIATPRLWARHGTARIRTESRVRRVACHFTPSPLTDRSTTTPTTTIHSTGLSPTIKTTKARAPARGPSLGMLRLRRATQTHTKQNSRSSETSVSPLVSGVSSYGRGAMPRNRPYPPGALGGYSPHCTPHSFYEACSFNIHLLFFGSCPRGA